MSQHKSEKKLPVVGITIGDLNGIGPEVIIKALREERFSDLCIPIIYASAQTITYHKKLQNAKYFNFNIIEKAEDAQPKKINLINAWDYEVKIEVGNPSKETGKAAYDAIKAAGEDLKNKKLDAVVTAPISKETVQQAGMNFPGHTEFFANLYDEENYLMLLVGEKLKVGTVSGHMPLKNVPEDVTKKKVLKAIKTLHRSLQSDFAIKQPKIAVLGLNPHAGENGTMGTEEKETIIPALEECERQGITAFGPYPADGFFGTQMYADFDAVLAMYHDQGLTPFKLLEFERGVNYTAGLEGIRTSPDHGTGYAIAGKNEANEQSFVEALYLAIQIHRNRAFHEDIHESPLESKSERRRERD